VVCDNIKEGVQGSSDVKKENKNNGYAYTYIPGIKVQNPLNPSMPSVNIPGGNLYFKCEPYKKDFHFKNKGGFFKNSALTQALKSAFCSSNKGSYTQNYKQTLVGEKNAKFSLNAKTVWNWKSSGGSAEGSSELGNENSKGNFSGESGGNGNRGSRGNRYTFDFDAIMKAIDNTGKCAGVSGSSDGLSGTSGDKGANVTQGTSGTSGTGGIQNPAPVSNKMSKELYYKMIGD
jgi:hypothetical protein